MPRHRRRAPSPAVALRRWRSWLSAAAWQGVPCLTCRSGGRGASGDALVQVRHQRLYVSAPDGLKVGWYDVLTGEEHLDHAKLIEQFRAALAPHLGEAPSRVALLLKQNPSRFRHRRPRPSLPMHRRDSSLTSPAGGPEEVALLYGWARLSTTWEKQPAAARRPAPEQTDAVVGSGRLIPMDGLSYDSSTERVGPPRL